jgi:hypothetical protein
MSLFELEEFVMSMVHLPGTSGNWFNPETSVPFDGILEDWALVCDMVYYTQKNSWVRFKKFNSGHHDTYELLSLTEAIDWLVRNEITDLSRLPHDTIKVVEEGFAEREL